MGWNVLVWFLLMSCFSCEAFELEFVFTQMYLCVRIGHVEIALWIAYDEVWPSQLTGESWDMELISLFQELKYFFKLLFDLSSLRFHKVWVWAKQKPSDNYFGELRSPVLTDNLFHWCSGMSGALTCKKEMKASFSSCQSDWIAVSLSKKICSVGLLTVHA